MLFLKPKKDINLGLKKYRHTPNAILLDVRNPDECKKGTIPGSFNLPLSKLRMAKTLIPDPATPIFAYCINGGRADRAVKRLQRMGYTNCQSIGGLTGYSGELK